MRKFSSWFIIILGLINIIYFLSEFQYFSWFPKTFGPMRISSAINLVLAGVCSRWMGIVSKKPYQTVGITICAFYILLVNYTLVTEALFGGPSGFHLLMLREQGSTVIISDFVTPLPASVFAMVVFASVALLEAFEIKMVAISLALKTLICMVGWIAVLGVVLDVPLLRYEFGGDPGMSFQSALGFVFLGLALIWDEYKMRWRGDKDDAG